ncbi:MAG: class I SAM-dependent methyltransferase [Thermoprotei archaeon]|nr:MAG: class I SAM-dependent methyltransferase [Thermoprotei archaeon]
MTHNSRKEKEHFQFSYEDVMASATLQDLTSLIKALSHIKKEGSFRRMLDLGCGYGGLTKYVADFLGIYEIYGIDIDEQRLEKAKKRGIKVYKVDLNNEPLPFPNNYFDVVTSFGVLEHLTSYDNIIAEAHRVLTKKGYFIISMPNLASWVNRIALLLGYQPRDVEISQRISPGILPLYGGGGIGHIHSATLKAMKELLEFYGFDIVLVKPLAPKIKNKLVLVIDKVLGRFASLSRRFIIIAKPKPLISLRGTKI